MGMPEGMSDDLVDSLMCLMMSSSGVSSRNFMATGSSSLAMICRDRGSWPGRGVFLDSDPACSPFGSLFPPARRARPKLRSPLFPLARNLAAARARQSSASAE